MGAAASMEKGRKKGRGAAARVEERKRGRGRRTKRVGRGTTARIGEEERGRLGLGRRGGLPSIECEINGPKLALSSKLPAPAEKYQKVLLFR
jgi:hypothetical protein